MSVVCRLTAALMIPVDANLNKNRLFSVTTTRESCWHRKLGTAQPSTYKQMQYQRRAFRFNESGLLRSAMACLACRNANLPCLYCCRDIDVVWAGDTRTL